MSDNYEKSKEVIYNCIDTCVIEEQFHGCTSLLKNFDKSFRRDENYKEVFMDDLAKMWDYLDEKYRAFTNQN